MSVQYVVCGAWCGCRLCVAWCVVGRAFRAFGLTIGRSQKAKYCAAVAPGACGVLEGKRNFEEV